METLDPIVQCTACGAKMRLKAASLKVLKQVRCGKCQAMVEIPESLKGGGASPEEPVVPPSPSFRPAPVPVQSPVIPSRPAPVPAQSPVVLPRPAPVSVESPVTPPAPVPDPAPPAPVDIPRQDTAPAPPPPLRRTYAPESASGPLAPQHNFSASNPSPVDTALVVRMEALEVKVNAQQESIALLTAQLRQIVKAQAAAVAAAQAVLDR